MLNNALSHVAQSDWEIRFPDVSERQIFPIYDEVLVHFPRGLKCKVVITNR